MDFEKTVIFSLFCSSIGFGEFAGWHIADYNPVEHEIIADHE